MSRDRAVRERPIRIFLLDDHEIVRRGLRDLFVDSDEIAVVGESGSAQGAAAEICRIRPDVMVLDVRLADGSGIEVCREVRSADPGIRAVILTSYDDDEALFAAIMAGAAGFVLKQIRGSELTEIISRVASGQSMIDPAVTARVLERVRGRDRSPAALAGLTTRERAILDLIAEGLTNRQIAQRLFLAEKTIKNHVSTLLAKLGLESRTQAALLAARLVR